ncbi:MAG: hypothetical protein IJI14_12195 [Anaerolineaceae bacterium]|nr:hypothetical protein [Anaerolineaceae bacterium]
MAATNLGDFTKAIDKFLDQCEKDVGENLESGLDEAQEYLIDKLKEASPKQTGDYAKHWKKWAYGKGYRLIANDKQVKMSQKTYRNVAHDKHLAGILEYSTYHNAPHIESTKRKARPKILKILKESITKDN